MPFNKPSYCWILYWNAYLPSCVLNKDTGCNNDRNILYTAVDKNIDDTNDVVKKYLLIINRVSVLTSSTVDTFFRYGTGTYSTALYATVQPSVLVRTVTVQRELLNSSAWPFDHDGRDDNIQADARPEDFLLAFVHERQAHLCYETKIGHLRCAIREMLRWKQSITSTTVHRCSLLKNCVPTTLHLTSMDNSTNIALY